MHPLHCVQRIQINRKSPFNGQIHKLERKKSKIKVVRGKKLSNIKKRTQGHQQLFKDDAVCKTSRSY